NVSCNGNNNGSITLSGSGGTGTLTYTIGVTTNTTGVFSSLTAGTYNYSVTDANGCGPVTGSVIITQPTLLTASVTSQTNISCSATTGSVTVAGSGGTPTYTYSLDGGSF